MRGEAATQATMLTAVTPDALVPQSHPIRRINRYSPYWESSGSRGSPNEMVAS